MMPDHIAGELYLADYLLYRLNQSRNFQYVEELNLDGPSNNIREISGRIAASLSETQRYKPDPTAGAKFFLQLFRVGNLGKVCLDHIPSADDLGTKLGKGRYQTEPPDPWTASYPVDNLR